MTSSAPPAFDPTNPTLRFLEEVSASTAGVSRLEMCIQCGTCGGSCPCADGMTHTPRRLFAMIRAGMRDEALGSNTPWICVSCYHCVVRCPQDVHIADVMYTLKGMAIQSRRYADAVAPDFSTNFIDLVERYGRSFELGLAARHYLRHFPLRIPGLISVALEFVRKKRMDIKPRRIEGIGQLRAILKRARDLETSA